MRIESTDHGWALLKSDRFVEALPLFEARLVANPDDASARVGCAMALWRVNGPNPTSLAHMERAVALAPQSSSVHSNLGILLSGGGDFAGAEAAFRQAIALDPRETRAFWALSRIHRFDREDGLVAEMTALFEAGTLAGQDREFLAYGLAKAFDDLRRPEQAMRYAIEANQLCSRPWESNLAALRLSELRTLAASGALRAGKTSRHPARPLFIVGMMRSGTTLLETMLSRNGQVHALGESVQIPQAEKLGRQRLAAKLRPGEFEISHRLDGDWLAARAEALVRDWAAPPGALVTDKLPDNAMLVGLIGRLFPKARIIHLRRHPLDVGVSAFFTRFGDGQGFTTRLDQLGTRIRQVSETMAIWKEALTLPILDMSYERLVADPEGQIRRIAAFAGLEWSDAYLTPEKATRTAQTASQWQVRQAINSRSIERWRAYEPWLGPMIEAMGGWPWIEAEMAEAFARSA